MFSAIPVLSMLLGAVVLISALLSILLILLLKPLLVRYALARPNARSSHKTPTPQGGGIAVIGAWLLIVGLVQFGFKTEFENFWIVMAATTLLAVVGAVDDIRPLPAAPRLVLQVIAVATVIAASGVRILPDQVPLVIEQALLVLAGVWFVNLVNFMDGLDWITVAEMIPITAFLAIVAIARPGTSVAAFYTAAVLCGALIGFAIFNKPVAKLFLGDVGSLPIGLLVGWLLLQLAGTGALAAAILLPLYYLADATITLLRRLARGERVWEAHRSHFYQQATTNGFSVLEVSMQVFGLNLALAALAALTLWNPAPAVQIGALIVGLALVGVMLRRFARPRRAQALTEISR